MQTTPSKEGVVFGLWEDGAALRAAWRTLPP